METSSTSSLNDSTKPKVEFMNGPMKPHPSFLQKQSALLQQDELLQNWWVLYKSHDGVKQGRESDCALIAGLIALSNSAMMSRNPIQKIHGWDVPPRIANLFQLTSHEYSA